MIRCLCTLISSMIIKLKLVGRSVFSQPVIIACKAYTIDDFIMPVLGKSLVVSFIINNQFVRRKHSMRGVEHGSLQTILLKIKSIPNL